MNEIERYIREQRAILKPSPVKLGKIPNWLRLRLIKHFGTNYGLTFGSSVLDNAFRKIFDCNSRILDHWGTTVIEGKKCFVSEPYHICEGDLDRLEFLADKIGCRLVISDNSWWYPGRTTRIMLCEER